MSDSGLPETEPNVARRRSFLMQSGGFLAGSAVASLLKSDNAAAQGAKDPPLVHAGSPASYNVRSFGARGDGTAVDSPAINRAIRAASAAGGGTVLLPAGSYLSFSIRLASYVTLVLEPGAALIAAESGHLGSYDSAEASPSSNQYEDFGHRHWQNSLIWGDGLEHIGIVGPGLIWGKGLSDGLPGSMPAAEAPGVGNKAIALKNCRNVQLRGFSILKGGHFGILATGVDNLAIDGLLIDTDRDGMDLDCCRNIRVSNCSVNSPDDAICPKSSYALGYPKFTENLTIANCYVTAAYRTGSMLDGTWIKWGTMAHSGQNGGIKFGTESNGGFLNTTITNCIFEGCHGLSIETVDGALLEDMTISNITMRDLISPPIFLRLGSRMRGPAKRPLGSMKRIMISDLISSNTQSEYCSIISGVPDAQIEDIRLRNIFVEHSGGRSSGRAMPELEQTYPEYSMFGAPTPSQGFYLRHVRNVLLNDVEIRSKNPDFRAAVILDQVEGAVVKNLKSSERAGVPLVQMTNVKDVAISGMLPREDVYIATATNREIS